MLVATILDDNQIYAHGIAHLLSEYFARKNWNIRFHINDIECLADSDIVFKSESYRLPYVADSERFTRSVNAFHIVLMFGDYQLNQDNLIFRHDPISTIQDKLTRTLYGNGHDACGKPPFSFWGVVSHGTEKLTHVEMQVLTLMAAGNTQMEVARNLRKSVKTISRQKRAAMKKLGLRNNMEFYRYIRSRENLPLFSTLSEMPRGMN